MIGIINAKSGNIGSLANALNYLKINFKIVEKKEDIENFKKIILPGVGAFKKGMENLKQKNLIETLNKCYAEKRTPILDVCLGFQLMAKKSSEFGNTEGLGWLDAEVKKFPEKNMNEYLKYYEMSSDEFIKIVNKHRNQEIWKLKGNDFELINKLK